MKTIFLMIARVLYDKGYQEYVDSAKIIVQEYQNVEFWLLGKIDEEYPNHVPKQIVENDSNAGYIHYMGYSSDVRPVINRADCIVHPTYYHEGMSRVLMEALAMKKPIITTNIPGCKETVENGYNGYVIPPRDVNALIEAVHKFLKLSDEEKRLMGEHGREKAELQFDVNKVIAVYRSITG